jgi:ABC-2 type transport system permease protein
MADSSIILDQARGSLAIAKKDLRVYYAKGPVVIFGVLMPAFLFLAFFIGRQMSVNSLIPGLLGMAVFFTSTAVSPAVAPWETQARTLERMASCPVAVWTILLGDMLASVLFGIVISFVPILVGLITGTRIHHPFILAEGILLAAFCFSTLVLIFSFPATSSPATIMMLSSLIKFPLVFVSGVFVPVGDLPAWARGIASFSPLTYFTEVSRYCLAGTSTYPLSMSLLLLFMFTILFWGTAVTLHKRTLPQRL